ncbi:MAG TPA: alpha/beta fold hydrolase [Polyangiales bacterium]|nr:alpha/beta fold hydrolase [Polyangiales bacterium]
MRFSLKLLVASLALVFGGAALASAVQRSGGVSIEKIGFAGTGGIRMSGLLYVPSDATAQAPAPAVLAIHGYINSRETQSPYAIELARRGFVVLALDQTGHGYSDPPALANGFGGPDGLSFLRTLPMVDKQRIVLEGHSMGGWASLIAAGVFRDAYRAIVVSGASTGTFGAPDGDASFPRNFGLVYARHDEFSNLMWGVPIASDIVQTAKLKKLFGTNETVEVGRTYGSIAAGTARKLYMPNQIHPANHITTSGIGDVLDWIQQVVPAPHALPTSDQIWYWKELGTALGLLGAILMLFAVGGLLLDSTFFEDLRGAPAEAHGATGPVFWISVVLTLALPALTYFPVQAEAATLIKPSAALPQNITTGLMAWALITGIVSLVLFALWHFTSARSRGASAVHYGLVARGRATGPLVAKSFALASIAVACAYVALLVCDLVFTTDFRFWVVAAKPLSALQWRITLSYIVPFTAYFLVLGIVLHGQLRAPSSQPSFARRMLRDAGLTAGGIIALLVVQYVPLLSGGTLAFPEQHLLSIVAFQLVFVLPVVGLSSSYFFSRTGLVYPGAFVNGLFVTWLLVGGQATHFAFR